ncbi:hypothetical protein D3C84_956130 [compost metagenome]
MSIHEVGALQPFSLNSRVLYANPVTPRLTATAWSLIRPLAGICSSVGLSSSLSHRPMEIARYMMPSSRNITCICGLPLLAWTLARISAEVPGTITTLTLFAFSKAGSTLSA